MTALISLLTPYAVPLIGTAVLALFAKPNKDKPPIWKRVMDIATKPTTTNTTTIPQEILKILPILLEQLLRKPPPAPEQPLPPPADTKTPQDLIAYVLSLLNMTTPNTPPAPTLPVPVAPTTIDGSFGQLVAMADAFKEQHPEYDVTVIITENSAECKKVKRAESK